MGLDSLYCGKWRKISKLRRDLDLDRTMPNVELVRAIFILYPILDKDSLAVASAPAEIVPETTVAPPNGLTASSSNLLCL